MVRSERAKRSHRRLQALSLPALRKPGYQNRMTRMTSAAELRAMALSWRRFAEGWPNAEGRVALLSSALEFEQLAVEAAREDERHFRQLWADTSRKFAAPAKSPADPRSLPATATT